MQPRITSPALTLPGVREALMAAASATKTVGVPETTLELIHIRVGQINGCAPCVDMHTRSAKKHGETEIRLATLVVWRETPYFTEAERAALALAEHATRLCDRPAAVPAAIWDEAAKHYSSEALAGLVLAIGVANLWNRLNVTTGQITGEWIAKYV